MLVRASAVALALCLAWLTVACSSSRPWKVPPERERRFLDAEKACKQLTDDRPSFDKCMKHRGFRKEYPGGF